MTFVDLDERAATVALSRVEGIGGATLRKLVARFGSAQDTLAASDDELLEVARVAAATVSSIREASATLDSIRQELQALEENEVAVLVEEEFPANLRAASDAPALLYVRGAFTQDDNQAVAIVGSREASPQGVQIATTLAAGLAERGVTVVSGLALGIDGAAHRGALAAGGRSIGVLGSGLNRMFPPENSEIAEAMTHRGTVVSELEPNIAVNPRQLMMRDRIVSGLSLAIIVVAAAAKSGTMDTAERARKQGRAVFAVDWCGDDERVAGNRRLLRGGALPIPADGHIDWWNLLQQCDRVAAQLASGNAARQPTLF